MNLKKLSVSVIIINYNGKKLLQRNLQRVIDAVGETEIVVVDDVSNDGSVEYVKKNFPGITILEHETNKRFAAACNTGFAGVKSDVVVLLNNDVVPEKNFLEPMLEHFDDEKVFAVGCLEYDGKVRSGRSGGGFRKGLFVHWRAEDQSGNDTLWVSGGSGGFRRNIWNILGGMDELFAPAYEEDRDICYRALKQGYVIKFEPKSVVNHKHESTNISALGRQKMELSSYKNHFLFVWKNITSINFLIQHLVWLPYQLVIGGFKTKGKVFWGFGWALKYLPRILAKRAEAKTFNKVTDEEIIEQYKNI